MRKTVSDLTALVSCCGSLYTVTGRVITVPGRYHAQPGDCYPDDERVVVTAIEDSDGGPVAVKDLWDPIFLAASEALRRAR